MLLGRHNLGRQGNGATQPTFQYHDKALSLLNDKSTYAVLNSDPTSKTQRKLNKMLLDLKKAGRISDSTYTKCYTVVTGYVHVFVAYLKFINREFL